MSSVSVPGGSKRTEEDNAALRKWLYEAVKQKTDTDPDLLSDYIIALINNNALITKEVLNNELNELLDDDLGDLVDTLLAVLQDGTYRHDSKASLAVPDRKRRLSDPALATLPTAPKAARGRGGMRMNGGPGRPKKPCFDYHQRGFCPRGVECPYEHSPDSMPFPPMPFPFMMPPPPPGDDGGYSPQQPGLSPMPMMPGFPPPPPPFQQPPNFAPRGRGRGGNPFGGTLSTRPPPRDNGVKTLVVTDIPVAHLSLESINDHFKRFGTVTNVAIESRDRKALVAFSSNNEAYSAWKSDEPIFGSRHVKVLWHKPIEGHGGQGQQQLEASAQLLENMRKIEQEGATAIQGQVQTEADIRAQLEQVKQQQLVLERNLAEQKVLMNRIMTEKSLGVEEKRELKERVKELAREHEKQKEQMRRDAVDVEALQAKLRKLKPLPKRKAPPVVASAPSEGVHSISEMMDEEMPDEETLALREKLAALKEEASSMGINAEVAARGGARGRGGRGRGRGAASVPPRGSMKLDNRPRTIAITGSAVTSHPQDVLRGVKEALLSRSDILREPYLGDEAGNAREDGGRIFVAFATRGGAEQMMAKGPSGIPLEVAAATSDLTLTWHATPAPAALPTSAATPTTVGSSEGATDVDMGTRGERGEED